MGLTDALALCDRRAAELRDLPDALAGTAPAWLTTLGELDWQMEKELIEQESYAWFLSTKRVTAPSVGFSVDPSDINPMLFEFQRDVVIWALKKGRAALFQDCGLGKTPQQLEWARHVCDHNDGNVLIFAPLAVSQQTRREGEKFGIAVNVCRSQVDIREGINVTNYEMMEHFAPGGFAGMICDESSILKGDGPMRRAITDFGKSIPFRLACTATPAPNDHMELGNHADYLGVMSPTEMLSMFFVHDGGETAKWRLKGHARKAFWQWVASWAVMMRKPSDLGYDDDGFNLPPLCYHQHVVSASWSSEYLFPVEAKALQERQQARRESLPERVALCADLVNKSREPWVVWCDLNAESDALHRAIPDSVEVKGADPHEYKERTLLEFSSGAHRVIVSKPTIAGYGMNWQHCPNMAFVGLSDSWEQIYQATRRCWRFGQTREVNCHFITGELEGAVVRNIERKEAQALEMAVGMVAEMSAINRAEVHGTKQEQLEYTANQKMEVPRWLR